MPMTDRLRAAWPAAIAILVALVLSGCSTTAENSGLSLVDASGKLPDGFVATHPSLVRSAADADRCRSCHGDNLAGGISGVSCLNSACHHNDPVTNWSSPTVHGAEAKKPRTSSGFASCQVCHGLDFAVVINGFSCRDCHGVAAPHPAKPWLNGVPRGTSHADNMSQANAPVCDGCHHLGANSTRLPSPPAPAGTAAGCFNNTLCHGALAPHPLGAVWNFPLTGGSSFHGASAKIDLRACQECHGTPGTILFEGGIALTACSFCHEAAKAHTTDWQGVRTIGSATITHRTATNPLDPAGQCAICHKVDGAGAGRAPGAPSCFSASFTNQDGQARSCHAGGPVPSGTHARGWLNSDNTAAFHGAFVGSINCNACHPIAGRPTCTTCHFDANGSRAYAAGGFQHGDNVFTDHRRASLAVVGNVCENCHQTSRTYRGGVPSGCGPTQGHPGNEGCHYNNALLDPVFSKY